MLFAVETYGYMGAVRFVNRLGDIAAESGHILKGSYKRFPRVHLWLGNAAAGQCWECWAMQLLSVTVQRGNAEMYCQSGLDW